MADDNILETRGLTKEFRGFVAVSDVNLTIRRGTIHALIGPNGAGKTTCFNLLTKFLDADAGPDLLQRPRDHRIAPGDVARLGLVRSFQISAVFPHLTVLENVRIALQRSAATRSTSGDRRGAARRLDDRALELIEAVGLAEFAQPPRGRAAVRAQARAGDRHHARPRPGDDAARRADRRHGARGHRAHRGADPERGGQPHRADGRAQPVGRRRRSRITITVLARGEILAEGDYATVSQEARRRRRPTWGRPCLSGAGQRAVAPDAAGAPLLSVRRLHAWYGESHILHGVDFDVRSGEVVTLLGRNGAGKTTTLRSIMGMVPRRNGSIALEGARPIGCRRTASRGSASPSVRRSAASSRASTSRRT